MNPSHKLYWLIGGVVALLIVASVIGRILRARVKDEKAAAVVDNLIARVRAWWWMVAVFAAAFLLGRNATIAMFAFISFFALREFLTLTPTKIGDHRALSVAFFIVIPIQYLLIATSWYGLFSIFIPVYGFLFLPSISVLAHDTGENPLLMFYLILVTFSLELSSLYARAFLTRSLTRRVRPLRPL